ncbi:MAG: T9SS type A sorting domain-containing protein [Bacteroidota bacterium]
MSFINCFILSTFLFLQTFSTLAQSGCTDPHATNYNPGAKLNDGSCVYTTTHFEPIIKGEFPNTIISESSGLVWTNGKLWTHNDSGNPNEIYSIDTANGNILQTVTIDNFPNTDWEDIAADSNFIYVGNFGNNNGNRTDLKILKVAKSDITTNSIVHLNAQDISFSYSDQTVFTSSSTHNFDCESLISIKDSLYIFTKDRGDLQTRVYKLPKIPGTYIISPYTSFNVNGLITGADYNPQTKEIALIGYFSGHTNSFMWFLNDFKGDMFFSGNKRRIEIGNGSEWQTEGICYFSNDRFLVSCENGGTFSSSFFTGNKIWLNKTTGIDNIKNEIYNISPNPVNNELLINNLLNLTEYNFTDVLGYKIKSDSLILGKNFINISSFKNGTYFLYLQREKEIYQILKVIKN